MKCSKCGKDSTGPRWHAQRKKYERTACAYDDTVQTHTEHLHYYCACGYDWVTQTKEQAGTEGGEP